MYELIKEFIKPELLILIPVISIASSAIRKSGYITQNKLPLFMGVISIILSALWIFSTTACACISTIPIGIFTSVTQGTLIAGASFYIPKLIKQSIENNKCDKD